MFTCVWMVFSTNDRHVHLCVDSVQYQGQACSAVWIVFSTKDRHVHLCVDGVQYQGQACSPLSRDKHHRDSGFCGISRGSLRDITRETAGYPAGVCGISRGRLRDIPRYSFGRPVVSRVPRSEKTWCETPKPTAARNGDGGVPNVYFYVLPGDLCWADGV
ncbi:hypothetical protein Bbelb_430400 [Branchiostoma belcheri]|nr:hypothetical protein Bbelb_430400 [Branchiostoma belcheri]